MITVAGLRPGAKATEEPPDPKNRRARSRPYLRAHLGFVKRSHPDRRPGYRMTSQGIRQEAFWKLFGNRSVRIVQGGWAMHQRVSQIVSPESLGTSVRDVVLVYGSKERSLQKAGHPELLLQDCVGTIP